jgi:hypothetical protein
VGGPRVAPASAMDARPEAAISHRPFLTCRLRDRNLPGASAQRSSAKRARMKGGVSPPRIAPRQADSNPPLDPPVGRPSSGGRP